jgi:hypothetical protein
MQERFGLLEIPAFALALGVYATPLAQQEGTAPDRTRMISSDEARTQASLFAHDQDQPLKL